VKLHDLRPAAGSRRERTRVGRGIAAGKGKTAGRGTKGQKSRAGASIPAWFEGGQTPIHIRVPKLRGFKNRFKVVYQVVNVGQVSEYAAAGRFGVEGAKKNDPVTVNAEALASAGLIGSAEKPVKVLGQGDVSEKLFVAADLFSVSARKKIEEAGGFVQVLAPEKPEKTDKVNEKADSKAKARRAAADEDDASDTPAEAPAAEASAGDAAAIEPEPVVSATPDVDSATTDVEPVTEDLPEPEAKPTRKRSSAKSASDE
jgi:large subunit ribosomal protein L15